MADNKNAQIRYHALDKCFSHHYKKFFIEELMVYCGLILTEYYGITKSISRRQILEDISFTESDAGFSTPIEKLKEGKKKCFRYEDKEFSIRKNTISPSEELQIKSALQILNRIQSIPGFDWANSIQARIDSGLNLHQTHQPIMSFQENDFLTGIEFLNDLKQNTINKQTLKTAYKSFKSNRVLYFSISPHCLKQYNTRWFLFGRNLDNNRLQNLALDGIQKIESISKDYIESNIDFDDYFDDIIGVFNNLDSIVCNTEIELSDTIVPYITSKPIHNSQIIKGNILK